MLYTPTASAERGLLLEPGNITADSYQIGVVEQIQFDDPSVPVEAATIRGVPAAPYIFMGVQEELLETVEADINHPPYNRAHRLLLPTDVPYAHAGPAGELYHAKEFGDLTWYTTTALSMNGIRLAHALFPAEEDVSIGEVDEYAKWLSQNTEETLNWRHSGFVYLAAASEFVISFDSLLRHDQGNTTPDNMHGQRLRLGRTAGQLLLATSAVLQSKLNTNLASVMSDNHAKITRRIRENTVFGTGGDKR
jgi:hypothetical protein